MTQPLPPTRRRPPLPDSWLNGIIAGISAPIIMYALLKGIEWILAQTYMPEGWGGFSHRFMLIVSLLANIVPAKVFERQERDYSMRGCIGITLFMALFITFYYYRYFS
ncbi:MAG TPA: hypothetical protein PK239_00730 [Chitinophagales bacterium]|nr:hypothetical protein [Chitinophagales bacterium]HRK25787.1 hypothetical protein [Chitinophagales bacterium]